MAFGQLVLPLPPGGGGAADRLCPHPKGAGPAVPLCHFGCHRRGAGDSGRDPGARESPLVCTPPAVITGALDIREESVVVVGSGMTGLETAELLSDRARNNAVLVLEAAPGWPLGFRAPTATG